MELTFKKLYDYTKRNVKRAVGEAELLKKAEGMTIDFPGFKYLRPGDYEEGYFVTLFLDIRGSTERAFNIGAKNTFVTIQALLPTLARIVDDLGGFVVDYPGDGIMAHWEIGTPPQEAIRNAVRSAGWMDDAVKSIVNPILQEHSIPAISCGIGISAGKVIITKLGIPGYFSAKAIGNSVNFWTCAVS